MTRVHKTQNKEAHDETFPNATSGGWGDVSGGRRTREGVVTKVEWVNPHTYFYVDVRDQSGKIVNWALETGSPGALTFRGWTRDTLKAGDRVTVYGYRSKESLDRAAARSVTLIDGRTLFGGQTDDGGPPK